MRCPVLRSAMLLPGVRGSVRRVCSSLGGKSGIILRASYAKSSTDIAHSLRGTGTRCLAPGTDVRAMMLRRGSILGAAQPVGFAEATISESNAVPRQPNNLTAVLSAAIRLLPNSTITLSGLRPTRTADSASLAVTDDNGLPHPLLEGARGVFTQSTGQLVVKLTGELAPFARLTMRFTLQNDPAVPAQVCVGPIRCYGVSGTDVAHGTTRLLGTVRVWYYELSSTERANGTRVYLYRQTGRLCCATLLSGTAIAYGPMGIWYFNIAWSYVGCGTANDYGTMGAMVLR
eukprot:2672996-Rhodomonas_salina.2